MRSNFNCVIRMMLSGNALDLWQLVHVVLFRQVDLFNGGFFSLDFLQEAFQVHHEGSRLNLVLPI